VTLRLALCHAADLISTSNPSSPMLIWRLAAARTLAEVVGAEILYDMLSISI